MEITDTPNGLTNNTDYFIRFVNEDQTPPQVKQKHRTMMM